MDHENDFELMEVIAECLFREHLDFAEIRNNIKKTDYEYRITGKYRLLRKKI